MKKLICICLCALLIFYCCQGIIYAENTEVSVSIPALSAECAVLMDTHSGRLLFEKNPDKKMGMASTTKLMTALVALHLGDKDMPITIPREAVGVEGSSVYLVEGEVLTLYQLLLALLLSSANDAAVAIAVALSGDVAGFVEEMNAYAHRLGLTDTHFVNPHGLYNEEHYTTARELGIIAAEVLKNDTLREIAATKKATIPHDGIADKRLLVNHNKLLSSYSGAIGMKTGFTKKTGRCLVSAAERDGLTLIAVTLNAPDDWRDHTALLDYGFENFERRLLYPAGSFFYDLPMSDAEQKSVRLTNVEPLFLTLQKGCESIELCVELPCRFGVGTVKRGERSGQVRVSAEGYSDVSPLIYNESVTGLTRPRQGFFKRIFTFFSSENNNG